MVNCSKNQELDSVSSDLDVTESTRKNNYHQNRFFLSMKKKGVIDLLLWIMILLVTHLSVKAIWQLILSKTQILNVFPLAVNSECVLCNYTKPRKKETCLFLDCREVKLSVPL